MARILRWSAAVAAIGIPVVIIVAAITEPLYQLGVNCSASRICEGVFVKREHRWGPFALLAVVIWIVVALLIAAVIDHVERKERPMDVLTSK